MILLLGIPSESPMEMVAEAALDRGTPFAVFNQRQAAHCDLRVQITEGVLSGEFVIGGQAIPFHEITGVYNRMMDWNDLPEMAPGGKSALTPEAKAKVLHLHQAINEWLEIAECRILNRPGAMASNASKPYQAQAIRQVGLDTPDTLITNDPCAAQRFRDRHRDVIYKSVSSVRSIVRTLGPDDDLRRVAALPTQFQARVPGTDVRVHVVGDEIFATRVRTEAVDYRYARRDGLEASMEPATLPFDVEERCRSLSKRLDLPLCGIDLRETPDGKWYCFEANPSPAFSYYEDHTGQPISDSIVRYLSGSTGP